MSVEESVDVGVAGHVVERISIDTKNVDFTVHCPHSFDSMVLLQVRDEFEILAGQVFGDKDAAACCFQHLASPHYLDLVVSFDEAADDGSMLAGDFLSKTVSGGDFYCLADFQVFLDKVLNHLLAIFPGLSLGQSNNPDVLLS